MKRTQNDDECQGFGCYSMGVKCVPMKVDDYNSITIWACEKCAEKIK